MILSATIRSFAHYELYWYPLLSIILISAIVYIVEFVTQMTKDENSRDANNVNNVIASTNAVASPSIAYCSPQIDQTSIFNETFDVTNPSDHSTESKVSTVVLSPTDTSCDDSHGIHQVDQSISSDNNIPVTSSSKEFSIILPEHQLDQTKDCKKISTVSTKHSASSTKTTMSHINQTTKKWNTFSTAGSVYSGSSGMTMTTTSVGSDDSVSRGTSTIQNHSKNSKKCGITWKESMGKSARTSTLVRRRSIRRRSLRQHSIWGQPTHY